MVKIRTAQLLLLLAGALLCMSITVFTALRIKRSNTERPTIGKVTVIFGKQEDYYERALALQIYHNDLWNYPMFVQRHQMLPDYWTTPAFILQTLTSELSKPKNERLEWLFWVDIDVVIMNPRIPLEIFLPPPERWSHIHALMTFDKRGLNNGVFFLRVHEWSAQFVAATMNMNSSHPGVELPNGAQSAMEILLEEQQWAQHAVHVPQRWFNAYTGVRGRLFPDPLTPPSVVRPDSVLDGDLLCHFPGHLLVRQDRMTRWLDVAERHLPQWELPLSQTTHRAEISQFWALDAENEPQRVAAANEKFDRQRKAKLAAWPRVEQEQLAEIERMTRVNLDESFMGDWTDETDELDSLQEEELRSEPREAGADVRVETASTDGRASREHGKSAGAPPQG